MANRQYIGARYVPKFYENSSGTSEWRSGVVYEPLTVVTYNGNSYTSKIPVPANIGEPGQNPTYWVATGVYNQQLEDLSTRMNVAEGDIESLSTDVTGLENKYYNWKNRKVLIIGDSYTDGYSPDGSINPIWYQTTCGKLGCTYTAKSKGGAGFAATSDGKNFQTLMEEESSRAAEYTAVIFAGGRNDCTYAYSTLTEAVRTTILAAKEIYTRANIYVAMIGYSTETPSVPIGNAYQAYLRGSKLGGAIYCNGAETALSDGSLMDSSKYHPNQAGHDAIGLVMYQSLACGFASTFSETYFSKNDSVTTSLVIMKRQIDKMLNVINSAATVTFNTPVSISSGNFGQFTAEIGTLDLGSRNRAGGNLMLVPATMSLSPSSGDPYFVKLMLAMRFGDSGAVTLSTRLLSASGAEYFNGTCSQVTLEESHTVFSMY